MSRAEWFGPFLMAHGLPNRSTSLWDRSVLEVRGSQVRLGIVAPPSITIHPGEIYERIREENLRSGKVGPSEVGALSERLRAIFPKSATPKNPSTE